MLSSILLLTGTGLFMALAIGLVAYYFGAKTSPKLDAIQEQMPGANCGGCGFAGCGDYAKAMLEGRAKPGLCPSMKPEAVVVLEQILGVNAEVKEPMVAVVCCTGDQNRASYSAFYNGINDCKAASIIAGGAKNCAYGCLGLGSCSRACPFGAIEITTNRLAIIHRDICTGCGKCLSACPRHVIKLVPRTTPLLLLCSSPDNARVKRNNCAGGCIGCRKCAKILPEGTVTFETGKFLCQLNIDKCKNLPPEIIKQAIQECPAHCLQPNHFVSRS